MPGSPRSTRDEVPRRRIRRAGRTVDRPVDHLRHVKQDWRTLAALASDHLGSTVGSVFGAVLIGLLVSIVLIALFWKLGVFRRPVNKWYDRGVKLYVPYLLVICVSIAAQCGFYRAVYNGLVAVNDAVVVALYQRAVGPALGSPQARQAFLTTVQAAARSGQNMGEVITGAIKEALHRRVAENGGLTDRAAVAVAGWFIDRYENDIASAVCYGVYLKAGGYLQLHSAGEPMDYHEFKEGADYLLSLDLSKVEMAVQGNLGALTHGLIESRYKGALKAALILGALLVLVPVVEWGVYVLVMRRQAAPFPVKGEDVMRFEPPADDPPPPAE